MTEKYSEKFRKAVDYVIKNEGGYVFDQNDYGGATKYGISQKSYPALNIRELSLEDAIEIYHKDFWLNGKFEQIPDKNLAIKFFDFTVNFGQRTATIILQRALRSVGIKMFKKTVYLALLRFLQRFLVVRLNALKIEQKYYLRP